MAIDLLKKKVGIVLEKRKLPKVISEVKFALDISGSMQRLYNNGTVQNLVDRALAVASQFDDDGEMEAWTFTSGFDHLNPITESKHENYVGKQILNNSSISKWGGTAYAPVMRDILDQTFFEEKITTTREIVEETVGFFGRLLGKKPNVTEFVHKSKSKHERHVEHPAFVIFITDGENGDTYQTEEVIKESAKHNIYWLMVGIGDEKFHFCNDMADKYDNVGFVPFEDVENISDEEFYLKLLNKEFCEWAKKFADQKQSALKVA